MNRSRAPAISWKTTDELKTTEKGTPFLQDLLDIFASLILSLELRTYKQFFRKYDNSFLLDSAVACMHSLKVSKVTRKPDPINPTRTAVTTRTATYSMNREAAEKVFRLCVEARLIEDATNPRASELSSKSIYAATPKGLHVARCYARDNDIDVEHLSHVLASQPVCSRLLHLARRESDDQLLLSYNSVLAGFRCFAGTTPNYSPPKFNSLNASDKYHVWSQGIVLMRDVRVTVTGDDGIDTDLRHDTCFPAASAVEWLCDFTSVSGREEAAYVLAHFVLYGFIVLVKNQPKANDPVPVKIQAETDESGTRVIVEGKFYLGPKAIYIITTKGCQLAWDNNHTSSTSLSPSFASSTTHLMGRPPGLGEPSPQPSQSCI